MKVLEGDAPSDALTNIDRKKGATADCFYIDLPQNITLENYIHAFYTTRLFKLERVILSVLVRKPSTDEDARLLSQGNKETFSAWSVELREPDQILLCDFSGKTKSWLMVQPVPSETTPTTRLYFGTVLVPNKVSEDGQPSFDYIFHLLSGFHRTYSRALLNAACKKLINA